MIYLDNAATSFPKPPSVIEAQVRCMQECGGNAGRGSHPPAMAAAETVFECRTVAAGFFAALMIPLGILSWQGPISILMIVALAINTVCMSFGIPQLLRKSILLTSTLVLIYACSVFSIGSILNESLAIISSIIGIVRFRKEKAVEGT